MKNILPLILTLLLTNCNTTNKANSEEFVRNSAFFGVYESDTTWISFQDTTYEMWTIRGQQQNGTWKINQIEGIEFLTLGDYCPGVYEIIETEDTELVVKEVQTRKSKRFTLTKIDLETFEGRIKKIKKR